MDARKEETFGSLCLIKTSLRSKLGVQQEYDRESSVYNLKRFDNPGGRYIDAVEKQLLAKHRNGHSVLEVGTATGRFVEFVLAMGCNYNGLDLSRRMLELVSQLGPDLVQADGEQIPYASETFHTVFCFHTFHFLPEPMRAVQEANRVLKNGGVLVLIFELDTWLRRLVLKTGVRSNQYYFTLQEVSEMMKLAGFRVVATDWVLKFPIEAYRKTPFTPALRILDRAHQFPRILATLGVVVGRKQTMLPEGRG